jgi:AraC-like DNA-binding protein
MIVMPIIVGVALYSLSFGFLRDEITRNNRILIQNMQSDIDNLLDETGRVSTQINYSDQFNRFIQNPPPMGSDTVYNLNAAVNELKICRQSNFYVKEFYVWLRGIDCVVTPDTWASGSDFFSDSKGYSVNEINQLKDVIKNSAGMSFFIPMDKAEDDGKIIIVQTLPLGSKETSGAVVVEILKDTITSNLDGFNEYGGLNEKLTALMIADRGGNMIRVNGGIDLNENLFAYSGEMTKIKLDSGNAYIIQQKSVKSGWTYISAVSERFFYERVRTLQNISAALIVLYIIFISFIAFKLLKFNYKPLGNLLSAISAANVGKPGENVKNEFDFIEKTLNLIHKENAQVHSHVNKQNAALIENFTTRLFTGGPSLTVSAEQSLSSFGIAVPSGKVVVLALCVDNARFLFEDESISDARRMQYAYFIIKNVVTELLQKNFSTFSAEINGMLFIGAIPGADAAMSAYEPINKAARQAGEFISENFNFTFTTAVSRLHDLETGAADAYNESLTALEYRLIDETSKVIAYDAITGSLNKAGFYYPLENERKLINCMLSGDKTEAEAVLNEIFTANFIQSLLDARFLKCFQFEIAGTMLRAIQEAIGGNEDVFLEYVYEVERIPQCAGAAELKETILKLAGAVCERVSVKGNRRIKECVIGFVEKNYTNTELSVSVIADSMAMHPRYISSAFKKQTGLGLLDYIMDFRIKKSKALLSETNANVEKIANAVGYANARTFTRVFKSIEGVTPTKYREISGQNRNGK